MTPPGGRQRRTEGGRHRLVKVRLNDAEHALLARRAEDAGVSVPRYLVEAGLAGDRTPAERRALTAVFLAALQDLDGAANNLNQLTRYSHGQRAATAGLASAIPAVAAAAGTVAQAIEDVAR